MMYPKIKRLFDILFSILGLLLLFPLFLIISLGIKIDSKGPILFRQKRIGLKGRHFNIYKFRTMKILTPKDTPTHMLENPDMWITEFGRFLRKTSLDEIPQLWNVLIGDMSFVGPRPALWTQNDLFIQREKLGVNSIRPGITGWAQVNGRDQINISEKVELDALYLSKLSFFTDFFLLVKTVFVVFSRKGYNEGKK